MATRRGPSAAGPTIHPAPLAEMLNPGVRALEQDLQFHTWVSGSTTMRHEPSAPLEGDLARGTYICAERGVGFEDGWSMWPDPRTCERWVCLFVSDNTLQTLHIQQIRVALYWRGVRLCSGVRWGSYLYCCATGIHAYGALPSLAASLP